MGYKKYVNDYSKEYIVKPNGKPGVIAVYKGKYFRFTADEATLRKARISLGGLSLLSVALTVIPLLYKSVGSGTLYVALPHVIALFPLIHLLLGVHSFCFSKTPMIRERRDKTEGRTVSSAIAAACILGITSVSQTVNCILSGFPLPDVIYLILLLAATAAAGAIILLRSVLKTEECTKEGKKV